MEKDLFKPIVAMERLDKRYEYMRTSLGAEPARIMANEVFQELPNPDGNFIEQFQTTGYDSRVFELYLHAYLSHSGFDINRDHERPDFIVTRNGLTIAIEATTVNPKQTEGGVAPTRPIQDLSPEELQEKLDNELPIRFGSPLFSKLNNRYWELEHCRGIPLIFAIEAFHEEGSLFFSCSSLGQYLYGLKHFPTWSEDDQLIVQSTPIEIHAWGSKIIPSDFFHQPNSEHISAVIFSNSGTFAKFNRMGYQEGYHRGNIRMIRHGTYHDPDPNATKPIEFEYDLNNPPLPETWGQGLMVFHNPNALLGIPKDYFPDTGQTYLKDGKTMSDLPGFHTYMSWTETWFFHREVFDSPKILDMPIESLLKHEFDSFEPVRAPGSSLFIKEMEWFADKDRVILGVLFVDIHDKDWAYAILGRDQSGAFRWIDGDNSIATCDEARDLLLAAMLRIHDSGQAVFCQE